MKVVENTPDRLIVEHVPWGLLASLLGFMAIWVAGSVLFIFDEQPGGAVILLGLGTVLPMVAVWLLVERNQLILDRQAATLELRRRGFSGFTRRPFRLEHVAKANVARDTPRLGSLLIEVSQGMDAGHHRFMGTNAKLSDVLETSNAINDWLDQFRSHA